MKPSKGSFLYSSEMAEVSRWSQTFKRITHFSQSAIIFFEFRLRQNHLLTEWYMIFTTPNYGCLPKREASRQNEKKLGHDNRTL